MKTDPQSAVAHVTNPASVLVRPQVPASGPMDSQGPEVASMARKLNSASNKEPIRGPVSTGS